MTPDLFDFAAAKAARDEGMAKAASRRPSWGDDAYDAIKIVARRQWHVHVDDVLALDIGEPHHPNAWGAVWMRAIRDDIIQRSNVVRPSKDPRKHAHQYPVYFSLICETGQTMPAFSSSELNITAQVTK